MVQIKGLDSLQGKCFISGEIDNWWDPDTEESYKKKAQCMIDQYSGFTDQQVNMKIDGVNNIGENIADNGGIKEAYNAYREFCPS
jgi:membrane metallo-endopeptidase-like protein 1